MQLILLGGSFETEDIARRLLMEGHEIFLDSREEPLLKRLCYFGKIARAALQEALDQLSQPKVVWSAELMGRQLRTMAEALPGGTTLLNSRAQYYEDNIQLAARLAENGARYIDVGTVINESRLSLFVGGDPQALQDVKPLLASVAGDGSYYHCGPAGSGHFLRCMQQKYEVQVQSALSGVISEIRRSPFQAGINLDAFLIFGHLFCKNQLLPDPVWRFLQTQKLTALSGMSKQSETAA